MRFANLAGAEGIEPSSAVLETDILPLNYAPKKEPIACYLQRRANIVLDKIAQHHKKSSGKYYKILIATAQAKYAINIQNQADSICATSSTHTFYLHGPCLFFYDLHTRREKTVQNRIEPPVLVSRLMTFVLAAALVVLMALGLTLYKMFPLNRPEIFFLASQPRADLEVRLIEMPPNDENLANYKKAFIREYIKARNEVVPNAKIMREKWANNRDGVVRVWSDDAVFTKFIQTDMWNAQMNNIPDFEFSCSVEFQNGAISPYSNTDDTYIVNFRYFCADSDRQMDKKDYKIKVKLETTDGEKMKWADRLENPLGIRVTEYKVESGNGDPLDTGFLPN